MKRNAATRRAEKVIERDYREWAAPMAHCVATGRVDGDWCHLRWFTGAGIKPMPCHMLPLCRELHRIQETDRSFFEFIGIRYPFAHAEQLFEIYERRDATGWAIRLGEIQDMVSRERVMELLARKAA